MSEENTMKKDVRINPHPGVQEINLREGQHLPEIRQPVKVRIKGNIKAPAAFYNIRHEQGLIHDDEAHVEVDRWAGTIKLFVNEQDVEAPIVTGNLVVNPDILDLKINEGATYDKEQLVKKLKLTRHLFCNVQDNMMLVKDLQQLEMKVEQTLEKKDDHRGSRSEVLRQTADSDLAHSFWLNIPMFRGEDPRRFEVELNYNVRDSQIEFWLTSPELAEMQGQEQDAIIEDALKPFREDGIVIIEK